MRNRISGLLMMLAVSLAACVPAGASSSPTPDLRQAAAIQATGIVQQAEATALIQQAKTRAATLLAPSNPSLTPGAPSAANPNLSQAAAALPALASPSPRPVAAQSTPPPPAQGQLTHDEPVVIVKISLASEAGLVLVQFHAPYEIARAWFQSNLSVTNEASGQVYNEVPVLPIVGPLIGRPHSYEQIGYFMVSNAPPPVLKLGDLVTVVMGDFRKEHVPVEP